MQAHYHGLHHTKMATPHNIWCRSG